MFYQVRALHYRLLYVHIHTSPRKYQERIHRPSGCSYTPEDTNKIFGVPHTVAHSPLSLSLSCTSTPKYAQPLVNAYTHLLTLLHSDKISFFFTSLHRSVNTGDTHIHVTIDHLEQWIYNKGPLRVASVGGKRLSSSNLAPPTHSGSEGAGVRKDRKTCNHH